MFDNGITNPIICQNMWTAGIQSMHSIVLDSYFQTEQAFCTANLVGLGTMACFGEVIIDQVLRGRVGRDRVH